MVKFLSSHSNLIKEYIEYKRNLGYLFKVEYTFKLFDEFLNRNDIKDINLDKETLKLWTKKRKNESNKTRYKRINDIRNYLLYLNGIGYYSYIPKQVKNYSSDFIPYIFSKKEINDFFVACDSIKSRNGIISTHIYPLLFRILYGCGLRISEALNIKINDINFDKNCILISNSKNGEQRLVPFDSSLEIIIKKYISSCRNTARESDYLFVKTDGSKCSSKTAYDWFRKILRKANISHGGRGKGPRIHDFRHTFSVHTLIKMEKNNLDLYYSLPILSKYLGHKSIEATEKYVRLTKNMYPEIIENMNKLSPNIFPGGEYNEKN